MLPPPGFCRSGRWIIYSNGKVTSVAVGSICTTTLGHQRSREKRCLRKISASSRLSLGGGLAKDCAEASISSDDLLKPHHSLVNMRVEKTLDLPGSLHQVQKTST
ncbi:unnamed protein product [Eretmochelys imbricata]